MALADDLTTLTECALSAQPGEYDRQVCALLDQRVGFAVAGFIRAHGLSDVHPGFDDAVVQATRARFPLYGGEYQVVREVARTQGGVAVDRDVLGVRRLERLACYDEFMRPHRGHATAFVTLERRGHVLGGLIVGRTRGGFAARELDYLRALRATLTLAEASQHVTCASASLNLAAHGLTPREREVLDYLRLGYTNAQIGSALGTRERTVRNQLSRVYEKLAVSGRTEALALLTGQLP